MGVRGDLIEGLSVGRASIISSVDRPESGVLTLVVFFPFGILELTAFTAFVNPDSNVLIIVVVFAFPFWPKNALLTVLVPVVLIPVSFFMAIGLNFIFSFLPEVDTRSCPYLLV